MAEVQNNINNPSLEEFAAQLMEEEEEEEEEEQEDWEEEEEEEEDYEGDEAMVPAPQAPAPAELHLSPMELTDQERVWAMDIKAAIETDPEVDNLSDYMYAQLALIVHQDVEAAVERALHLQAFREEYGVTDNVPEGRKIVQDFVRKFSGLFLSLSYYNDGGNYVLVYDLTAFEVSTVKGNPENMRLLLVGLYYFYHAMTPDLASIRRGCLMMCECEGFDWRKNVDFETLRKVWTEILMVYPIEYKKMKYFNTGVFMNMLQSLKKRFLPPHITRRTETGCKMPEGGRLGDFYLVPDLQAANERMCRRTTECLLKRQENEKNFKLQ